MAVNRTTAAVVLGRLSDTGAYVGKGYFVLRDLPDWTVAVNDVFIYAGTDRGATFLLVSAIPQEVMTGVDRIDPQEVEKDRETNWRVIYNHEIQMILGTGRYQLPKVLKPLAQLAQSTRALLSLIVGDAVITFDVNTANRTYKGAQPLCDGCTSLGISLKEGSSFTATAKMNGPVLASLLWTRIARNHPGLSTG